VTRVFVAAPTAARRLGLRALLAGAGIDVIGAGATAEAAPAGADVVVIADDEMVTRLTADPDRGAQAVVVLAEGERAAWMLRERHRHGWAVVSPEPSATELRAAVVAAAEGFTVLPAALARRLFSSRQPAPRTSADEPGEPLTPREREVLELLAQGLSNRRIAERLGVSEHTAKFHVASICGKLQASSRTEAVSHGLRRGLISV
jgi:DNA-binding NarL/FixJ family response regulator